MDANNLFTSAIDTLREHKTNNPDKTIEVYTTNGMYYGNGDKWFKENDPTPLTFDQLVRILNERMIVSVYASRTLWSLPGADVRDEYVHGIYTLPLIEPRSSRPTDECSICLTELDDNICKIDNNACVHVFHCDCIGRWVTPRGTVTCPLCKRFANHTRQVRYVGFGSNSLADDIRYLMRL